MFVHFNPLLYILLLNTTTTSTKTLIGDFPTISIQIQTHFSKIFNHLKTRDINDKINVISFVSKLPETLEEMHLQYQRQLVIGLAC